MKVPKPKKRASGKYYIQLRLNGQSVYIDDFDKDECAKKAQLIKAEYLSGKRIALTKPVTLDDAMTRYIDARRDILSPSTIRGYTTIQRNRFQKYMHRNISSVDWQKAINEETKLCAYKTLKNSWMLVKSVLEENDIHTKARLPNNTERHERPWLTPEQIPIFMEAIEGEPCEIVALLELSSLRRSEALGLTWDNVDLKNKIIHVRGAVVIGDDQKPIARKQNKTAASVRDVPIFIPRLFDVLNAVEDKTGAVIKCHPNTPYKQIQAICEREGLPNPGNHGLRHSFASLGYSQGITAMTVQKIGGWSDIGTVNRIYTHLSDNDKAKGVDKLASFFENATKNATNNQKSQ